MYSSSLVLRNVMCFRVIFFTFLVFGVCWASWTCGFIHFVTLERSGCLLFMGFPFSLLSCKDSRDRWIRPLDIVPLSQIFSLSVSFWAVSITLSASSPAVFPSVVSILMLLPSSVCLSLEIGFGFFPSLPWHSFNGLVCWVSYLCQFCVIVSHLVLLRGHVLCFLVCQVIFVWMPDIVGFTLLGCLHSCKPCWALFWGVVTFLGTVWPFGG